ncbi:putative poly(ADP-ribose) glycohydrolase [Septoria linicola]|nr:putative poly(ADP-ribose) glycohydrolase [Septoria linicola]
MQKIQEGFEEVEALQPSNEDELRRGWSKAFTTLLKDIAYSLHGDGDFKTDGLEDFLNDSTKIMTSELPDFRKVLFSHALRLDDPKLPFASGSLAKLCTEHTSSQMTSIEVDTLLAHMLIGTLSIPSGNTWGRPGFTELYARSSTTAHAYLQTLFSHFAEGGYSHTDPSGQIAFYLHNASTMPDLTTSNLPTFTIPTRIVPEPSENSTPSDPSRSHFLLIAAHSQPGPGPNGTQEERLVGQSPPLALISVSKPLLQPDEAIITSPLWAHSSWSGHGRQARMTQLFDVEVRRKVRYIVADALELDVVDRLEGEGGMRLPDLREGNVEREVRKLFAAFSGAKEVWERDERQGRMKIEMPPWGCGAFGGDLAAKVQCMMMAAAVAGMGEEELELVVTEDRERELDGLPKGTETVSEMYARLTAGSRD